MKFTRRQFLRGLALALPSVILPGLVQAQEPEHKVYLPIIGRHAVADFPCTGILDTFPVDGGPPPNANWTNVVGFNGLQVTGGVVVAAVPITGGIARWTALSAANCEYFITVVQIPVDEEGASVALRADAANNAGYVCRVDRDDAGDDLVSLFNNTTGAILGSQIITLSAGDRIGIRACGLTISGYYCPSGGAWSQFASVTDAAFPGVGYAIIYAGQDCQLDDFGGGDLSEACCPSEWEATAVPVTTKCAEDPILALVCANGDRLDLITWEAGFELDDPGWRPQVAQFKGGGSYSNSQIAEGQTLVAGEYDNVVETTPLVARGTGEAKCIQTYRHLQQFIKRASDYWREPSEYDDVWLEVRPAGLGCRIGYARVVKATCVDFANPFGQPFASPQPLSVADGLSLVVEREPLWRAVPPGEIIGPLYNLLKNPDFEEWNSGVADSQPDCWSDLELIGVTGTNARDATPKWGRYALKVDVTGSTGAGLAKGVTQQVEGTEDGQEYTVVAWVRNAGVTNGVGRILITSLLGNYEVYRSATQHGWTLYTETFTTGVGDVIGVNCEILSTAAGCDGTVYFDSLMLLKGDWEEEAIDGMLPYMSSSHIFNHWDTGAGHLNYVDAWEVPGDGDALVRLEIVNETTPASSSNPVEIFKEMRVGQRRTKDVQQFTNFYDPSGVADATGSNGDRITTQALAPSWKDITSFKVLPLASVQQNVGRFRIYARIWDAKASAPSTLAARLRYSAGVSGVSEKILEAQSLPGVGAWYLVNLTDAKAAVQDFKGQPDMPGQLSYTLQLSRATGNDAARVDYLLLMPTDGGYLNAEFSSPMYQGMMLAVDNTASSRISIGGARSAYKVVWDNGLNCSVNVFKDFLDYSYAGCWVNGPPYGYLYRRPSGDWGGWTQVVTFAGRIGTDCLEEFNGQLCVGTGAGGASGEVYSSTDGVSFALVSSVFPTGVVNLKSFDGYLWIGADQTVYRWDGTAVVLSNNFGVGNPRFAVYNNLLYATVATNLYQRIPGGDVWNLVGGWPGGGQPLGLRVFKGKLYAYSSLAQYVWCYDGTAFSTVWNGGAGRTVGAIGVVDDKLYLVDTAIGSSYPTIYSSEDGVTWVEELTSNQVVIGVIYVINATEDRIDFGGATSALGTGAIVTFVPAEEAQYGVTNYQMGGGQNGGFTAPNRRLPDDERRHRWVFSYDRSDGSNVISDKALIGLGFVPRYLSLLGEG